MAKGHRDLTKRPRKAGKVSKFGHQLTLGTSKENPLARFRGAATRSNRKPSLPKLPWEPSDAKPE